MSADNDILQPDESTPTAQTSVVTENSNADSAQEAVTSKNTIRILSPDELAEFGNSAPAKITTPTQTAINDLADVRQLMTDGPC